MPPVIDLKKCKGCGTCDAHCPLDVILFDQETKIPTVKYPDECWHCGSCGWTARSRQLRSNSDRKCCTYRESLSEQRTGIG